MPSSCTHVRGISASMSMTFDMDAGMASYVGAGAAGAAEGAGRDAARAAAMDVAAILRSQNDERNVHWMNKNLEAFAKQKQIRIRQLLLGL